VYRLPVKIAQLVDRKTFRLAEEDIDPPGPGEVQVAVQRVGICGSDLHAYAEGAVGDMSCVYPMVLGHEPAGVVAALGAGVSGLDVGTPAAFEPAHYCYHCELCLRGRHNICSRLRFLSTPGHPGFFRQRVNLPVANVLPLPAGLGIAEGTLIEPLAVVLHAISMAPPVMGDTALVLGAGPIGLLMVAALKRVGVGRLHAVEPVPHRRELARVMGADAVRDELGPDGVGDLLRETGGRGFDLVFDCATSGTEEAALVLARTGGQVVFVGIPAAARIPMDVHLWRRKELSVHQVRRSNHDGPAARDLLARESHFFAPLLTHQRPLEQIDKAFALVHSRGDGVGKLLISL
jgi:L-iditol 2-dehydrogenase